MGTILHNNKILSGVTMHLLWLQMKRENEMTHC